MDSSVPDRGDDRDLHIQNVSDLYKSKATCGHQDLIGYMVGGPCAKCTRKAYRKAIGKK